MVTDTIKQLKAELLEQYMSEEVTNPEEVALKNLKIRMLDSVTDSLIVYASKKGEEINSTSMTVRLKTELDYAVRDRADNPHDEVDVFVEIINYFYNKFLELSSIEGA